jgi:membrane protease YdiL (CAAX protease family)
MTAGKLSIEAGLDHTRRKIVVFLTLTFAFSAVAYLFMAMTGTTRDVALGWMWSPGLAALLTQIISRERLRDLGWKWPAARYLLIGYLVPLGYAAIIYGSVWALGLGGFQPQPPARLMSFAILGLAFACLAGLGEEIGWRGLLIPELTRITSFTKAALLTGLIWAAWHYPAILFADYHSAAPRWLDLVSLSVTVVGLSFFTAWLRLRSGSLWPVAVWHGAHNLFVQQIFLDLTRDTGQTYRFVDDFGLGVLIASAVLGVMAWARRAELRG